MTGFNYTTAIDPSNFFAYKAQFDTARVIGAVCTITYIGSLQNQSGVINIGADLIPMCTNPIGGIVAPTNAQLYNLLLFKKYPASETTRSVWFPVDPTCQEFIGVGGSGLSSTNAPDFSMLAFYFSGYGLPVGSVLDITVDVYYEAIPNLTFTNLFVASQGTSKERKEDAWDEIMSVGKQNLGQILITGAKSVADWIGGPVGKVANKALSWLAS
jgi:hypothetical protein